MSSKMSLKLLLLFQLLLAVSLAAQTKNASSIAECKEDFDYYYEGYCYTYCPRGTYYNPNGSYSCLGCPSHCGSCSLNSTTDTPYCTSCSNGLGSTVTGGCFEVSNVVVRPLIAVAIFLGALFALRAAVEVYSWSKSRAARQHAN